VWVFRWGSGMNINDITKHNEDTLTLQQINSIWRQYDNLEKEARKAKAKVQDILHKRFQSVANNCYMEKGTQTGKVSWGVGSYKVAQNRKKTVTLKKDKTDAVIASMERLGLNPDDYIKVSYSTNEKEFKKWPREIQNLFEDARVINIAKPVYSLEEIK
jgi:hypothetical protein